MSDHAGPNTRRSRSLPPQGDPDQDALNCVAGPTEEDPALCVDKQRIAAAEFSSALRDMASNLLRVIGGAGRPEDIHHQGQALHMASTRYYEAIGGAALADEIGQVLSIEIDQELVGHLSPDRVDRLEARQLVIRGALRVAASRLLAQTTHESRGHREMDEGILALTRLRAAVQRPDDTPAGS